PWSCPGACRPILLVVTFGGCRCPGQHFRAVSLRTSRQASEVHGCTPQLPLFREGRVLLVDCLRLAPNMCSGRRQCYRGGWSFAPRSYGWILLDNGLCRCSTHSACVHGEKTAAQPNADAGCVGAPHHRLCPSCLLADCGISGLWLLDLVCSSCVRQLRAGSH